MLNDLAKGPNQGPKLGSRDLRRSSVVILVLISVFISFMKSLNNSERDFVIKSQKYFSYEVIFLIKRKRKIATR